MKKFYEKHPPKPTGEKCKNPRCGRKLTTADTLYSKTPGYCFQCNGKKD